MHCTPILPSRGLPVSIRRTAAGVVLLLLCAWLPATAQKQWVVTPVLDTTHASVSVPAGHRHIRRPRVGLVLSGGGARGVAQVGVIRELERSGVPIDFIAATSIGSIIGGLYASGYTTTELESICVHTDWDEVLSLADETKRTDLYLDQKLAVQRGFLVLRFEGLEPVLPSAVSSGQRLTEYLSNLTLQAIYHPYPTFDELRIPFRAMTTDLVSGHRVILRSGSLAEALRASATVPLLFDPVERDSMRLVDGGLLSNIPVDVARAFGCDIVIAVNSASGLRSAGEMKAPWETADQIMGIMMGPANALQLARADVVVTPEVGRHLSSNFGGLDSLILQGEAAAAAVVRSILTIYAREKLEMAGDSARMVLHHPSFARTGDPIPDSLWRHILADTLATGVRLVDVQDHVNLLYETGDYASVRAEISTDSTSSRVTFNAAWNPPVKGVAIEGCVKVRAEELLSFTRCAVGRPLNHLCVQKGRDDILRLYRSRGYSLARIDTATFDPASGILHWKLNEGVISSIRVVGTVRTSEEFVLSDFPLQPGEVFEISKARSGFRNINSGALFDHMYLEVAYAGRENHLVIRLKERPSQLIRLGVRGDNERHVQGQVDIRDISLGGGGTELGFTGYGGQRSAGALLEYKAYRLFGTHLTFKAAAFASSLDSYLYEDAPPPGLNQWDRVKLGEYRDTRYGGIIAFGLQLERFGNLTAEYVLQDVRTEDLGGVPQLEERTRIGKLRLGTIIDSKDRYPFPTSGIGLTLSYETASKAFGSQVAYSALHLVWERYATAGRFTVRPRVTLGYADQSMPFSEEFRLGGQESMFGVREDDRRGRQLLQLNLEFRYLLPFRILVDSYLRGRFDMASMSAEPGEIKLETVRYGLGLELALDTPIGPAVFSVGKGFYFGRDLPNNPLQEGPLLLYFMFGYVL
jgi:NTE family protein